jgi:hypothetical protein
MATNAQYIELKSQNDKLQQLRDNVDAGYTQQSYSLDQLQNLFSRNKWFYIIYYGLVVLLTVTIFTSAAAAQLFPSIYSKFMLIIIIAVYPYVIYSFEQWVYNAGIILRIWAGGYAV